VRCCLAYREDRRTVAVATLNLVLLALPYAIDVRAIRLPYVLVCGVLAFSAWAIVHNHIHVRTFRIGWLDAGFSMLLSLTVGHPATGLVLTHNMNHHVHIGGDADWSRPANGGRGWGLVRLLRYAIVTPVAMARGRAAPGAPKLPVALVRRRSRERWLLYSLMLAALALAPSTFFAFTLPIWIAGSLIFLGINLLQHDACEPGTAAHSRDFTGRFVNFIFFNGGYHTVHHERPGLHWSRLPAEHARLFADRARPDLEAPSLLGFVVREYLWRVR